MDGSFERRTAELKSAQRLSSLMVALIALAMLVTGAFAASLLWRLWSPVVDTIDRAYVVSLEKRVSELADLSKEICIVGTDGFKSAKALKSRLDSLCSDQGSPTPWQCRNKAVVDSTGFDSACSKLKLKSP